MYQQYEYSTFTDNDIKLIDKCSRVINSCQTKLHKKYAVVYIRLAKNKIFYRYNANHLNNMLNNLHMDIHNNFIGVAK